MFFADGNGEAEGQQGFRDLPASHKEIMLNIMGHHVDRLDVPPARGVYNLGES